MFNIKKSLLCISAISCMSLYATDIQVNSLITIGEDTKGNSVATGLTNTDYNKWEGNTLIIDEKKIVIHLLTMVML